VIAGIEGNYAGWRKIYASWHENSSLAFDQIAALQQAIEIKPGAAELWFDSVFLIKRPPVGLRRDFRT